MGEIFGIYYCDVVIIFIAHLVTLVSSNDIKYFDMSSQILIEQIPVDFVSLEIHVFYATPKDNL
jgi:hypothetical protein